MKENERRMKETKQNERKEKQIKYFILDNKTNFETLLT